LALAGALFGALLLASSANAEGELAVVAHAEWQDLKAISLPVLRQLYLGRRTRISGRRTLCLDLPSGSRPRGGFARAVLGLTPRALDRYWLRQALSGGPPPPRELGTSAELLTRVARSPGTLGYVPWEDVSAGAPPGVRIVAIEVDGRAIRPGERGYPIVMSPR